MITEKITGIFGKNPAILNESFPAEMTLKKEVKNSPSLVDFLAEKESEMLIPTDLRDQHKEPMKTIWKSQFTLEDLQKRCENSLVSHLGIVFTEIGDNYLVAEMPIESHHLQPMGILHGGSSAVLAETIASVAASCAIDLRTYTCVGLDLNINHLKPVHSGKLTAKTFPYHIGRTTQVWSIEIRDDREALIAISRLTVANLEKRS